MFLNNTHRMLLLAAAFLLLLAMQSARAEGDAPDAVPRNPVEVQLEGEVKVGGEQVVLGDVATIYAKSLPDFKALSTLVISRIPDDKPEVRLPASYLRARIQAALPPGTKFALRAPGEVLFRLQRLGLTAQDLAGEIARQARAAGKVPTSAEIEVLPLSGLEQLKGWNLAATRVEPPGELERWKGDLSFKLFRTDAPAGPPVWVRARVRWFQKAWVAARALSWGAQPDAAQFTEGRIETTTMHEEPVAAASGDELAELLKSSKLRRALSANAPLLASHLERKPDASPGSLLRVVFISEGGVRVSADGSLVGPGSIGADVKARLKSSKKMVTGKLVSQGLVEVSL